MIHTAIPKKASAQRARVALSAVESGMNNNVSLAEERSLSIGVGAPEEDVSVMAGGISVEGQRDAVARH